MIFIKHTIKQFLKVNKISKMQGKGEINITQTTKNDKNIEYNLKNT